MGASAGPSLTTTGLEVTGESEGDTRAGGESVGEFEGEEAVGPKEEEEDGVVDGGEEARVVFETRVRFGSSSGRVSGERMSSSAMNKCSRDLHLWPGDHLSSQW